MQSNPVPCREAEQKQKQETTGPETLQKLLARNLDKAPTIKAGTALDDFAGKILGVRTHSEPRNDLGEWKKMSLLAASLELDSRLIQHGGSSSAGNEREQFFLSDKLRTFSFFAKFFSWSTDLPWVTTTQLILDQLYIAILAISGFDSCLQENKLSET